MQPIRSAPVAVADLPANIAARIDLRKPIKGHQGDITSIHLREPVLGDLVECGPLIRKIAHDLGRPDMRWEFVDDAEALMKWVTRLSGLHTAVVQQMSLPDVRAVQAEVARIVDEFGLGSSAGNGASST